MKEGGAVGLPVAFILDHSPPASRPPNPDPTPPLSSFSECSSAVRSPSYWASTLFVMVLSHNGRSIQSLRLSEENGPNLRWVSYIVLFYFWFSGFNSRFWCEATAASVWYLATLVALDWMCAIHLMFVWRFYVRFLFPFRFFHTLFQKTFLVSILYFCKLRKLSKRNSFLERFKGHGNPLMWAGGDKKILRGRDKLSG